MLWPGGGTAATVATTARDATAIASRAASLIAMATTLIIAIAIADFSALSTSTTIPIATARQPGS